jgi:hypothetical protein
MGNVKITMAKWRTEIHGKIHTNVALSALIGGTVASATL